MFCGFCGNQMPDGARFCTNCGNPLQMPGQQPSNNGFTRMDPAAGNQQQGQPYNVPPQGYNNQYSAPPQGNNGYNAQYGAPAGGYAPHAGAAAGRAAAGAVKHASHLGLILGICGAIAAVLVIVLVVVPAVSGRSPEKTIAQLEESLNKLDMDGIMDCLDSSSQQMMEGTRQAMDSMFGIVDSFADTNLGDLYGLAEGLGGIMGAAGLGPEFSIDIININQMSDTYCVADVNITVTMPAYYGSSETESQYLEIPMVKEGNDWCITITSEIEELFNNLY